MGEVAKLTPPGGAKADPYFIPAEAYTSADHARREKERLWPRVWQIACRVEQLPDIGSQIVYDICDDSILVVRAADGIRAFYNACPHRGRQLASGARRTQEIVCPFHGWRFKLDGRCSHVPYGGDWQGSLGDADRNLVAVQCDTWGGFVFVNPDPAAAPLADFLGEVVTKLGPYEIENQRFRWAASVEINCNWKLAIEAFDEAYHVQTTHPQLLKAFDDRTTANITGPHGYLRRSADAGGLGTPSPLLGRAAPDDVRPLVLEFMRQMVFDVKSVFAERDMAAAARIMTELPADVSAPEALGATLRFRREAAEAAGVGWPAITPEQMATSGSTWHIFPNIVVLPQPTASLWYRARPLGRGDDPERCLFEFWALERYAPGYAPEVTQTHYADWRTFDALPSFLAQDFANLPYMQAGVRSRGFRGARVNPVQEGIIANYHAHIRAMIDEA
ncbi:aromatic ring-hydroxylating oxygenase subunit alpha [Sphingomonas immobilis]|uniref:SRPBCC family protein n=1 Tax=Sphingomonas immobilis TaxID=3063997 RepID=A0ABT8ZX94_9SPHN|nr:SRPBCC family protein [Sphingomonas sp. CA1-15]MDO7842183.1 SRPBCC family protein [Sphingomonas sp. CA1-15]